MLLVTTNFVFILLKITFLQFSHHHPHSPIVIIHVHFLHLLVAYLLWSQIVVAIDSFQVVPGLGGILTLTLFLKTVQIKIRAITAIHKINSTNNSHLLIPIQIPTRMCTKQISKYENEKTLMKMEKVLAVETNIWALFHYRFKK